MGQETSTGWADLQGNQYDQNNNPISSTTDSPFVSTDNNPTPDPSYGPAPDPNAGPVDNTGAYDPNATDSGYNVGDYVPIDDGYSG